MEKSLFNNWCWKNWTATRKKAGAHPYTIHKSKVKMDERPKCETENHKHPKEEHRQ